MARRIEQVLVHGLMGAGRFRTREELAAMLPGLELLPPNSTAAPGVAVCDQWWPDGPRLTPLSDAARRIAGAVGRKPRSSDFAGVRPGRGCHATCCGVSASW